MGRAELEHKCCAVLICSFEAIEPYPTGAMPISCHLCCFRQHGTWLLIKTATGGLGQKRLRWLSNWNLKSITIVAVIPLANLFQRPMSWNSATVTPDEMLWYDPLKKRKLEPWSISISIPFEKHVAWLLQLKRSLRSVIKYGSYHRWKQLGAMRTIVIMIAVWGY